MVGGRAWIVAVLVALGALCTLCSVAEGGGGGGGEGKSNFFLDLLKKGLLKLKEPETSECNQRFGLEMELWFAGGVAGKAARSQLDKKLTDTPTVCLTADRGAVLWQHRGGLAALESEEGGLGKFEFVTGAFDVGDGDAFAQVVDFFKAVYGLSAQVLKRKDGTKYELRKLGDLKSLLGIETDLKQKVACFAKETGCTEYAPCIKDGHEPLGVVEVAAQNDWQFQLAAVQMSVGVPLLAFPALYLPGLVQMFPSRNEENQWEGYWPHLHEDYKGKLAKVATDLSVQNDVGVHMMTRAMLFHLDDRLKAMAFDEAKKDAHPYLPRVSYDKGAYKKYGGSRKKNAQCPVGKKFSKTCDKLDEDEKGLLAQSKTDTAIPSFVCTVDDQKLTFIVVEVRSVHLPPLNKIYPQFAKKAELDHGVLTRFVKAQNVEALKMVKKLAEM